MKILVTGSSGMIGSELVVALEQEGYEVVGLDRRDPEFTTPKNFVKYDLLNSVSLNDKFDLIIHLAAHARVWELTLDPSKALENVTTAHNIFEYARKTNSKIMVASSREVYGNDNELPVNENAGSQRKTESVYAASKVFLESYSWAYMKSFNLDTKIIRFSNVYGKFDFSDRFIPKVIRSMRANEDVEIYDERKLLDFTYLSDAVQGVIHLIKNWDKTAHKEFNIASGIATSLVDVASNIKTKLGSKSNIKLTESHPGEVLIYQADISRMQEIGWKPLVGIEEGLIKSIEYYSG